MIKSVKRVLLIVTAAFMVAPSYATAVGNIHIGNTEVNPSIGVAYRHDDNIYLTDGADKKEVDDNIMVYSPAIELKNERENRLLSLEYGVDILRYSDEDDEDKEDHRFVALIDTKFPGGLMLKLKDTYVDTADPASSELTDLNDRTQNIFEAEVGADIYDRLTFILKYKETDHDYDESSLDNFDRSEEIVGGELQLKLLPKTSFFLEYENETIEYDEVISNDNRDSTTDRYFFGMKGQVSSKVYVNVSLGYETREYDQTTGVNAKEDFSGGLARLELKHEISEFTKLTLEGHRKEVESFYLENNSYTENMVSLDFFYRINYKISTKVTAFYGTNEYNESSLDPDPADNVNKTRDDDLMGFSINITYDIQPWLQAEVGYLYRERDSNFDFEDYEDNQYSISITAEF